LGREALPPFADSAGIAAKFLGHLFVGGAIRVAAA
jgi:hypothetical protein